MLQKASPCPDMFLPQSLHHTCSQDSLLQFLEIKMHIILASKFLCKRGPVIWFWHLRRMTSCAQTRLMFSCPLPLPVLFPRSVLLGQVHLQGPSKPLCDVVSPLHWVQSGPLPDIRTTLHAFSLTICVVNNISIFPVLILRLNRKLWTPKLCFIYDMVFLRVPHTVSSIKWSLLTN